MENKVIGIIMTYNCAHLVEETYQRLPKGLFYKIIIVDDGSRDSDEIARIAQKHSVDFFSHEHTGYGGNIKYGLAKASVMGGDYMVEIHGDGQFGPEYIKAGIEKITKGYDFVMGSRFTDLWQPLKDKMSLARYLANIGLSFFDRLILRAPLTEYHGGLRFYSKKLVQTLDFTHTSNDYLFSFEVIAQAAFHKLKISEIPIRADYSKEHTSISIKKATIYAFQTFWVLVQYIAARLGMKMKLFT